MTVALPASFDRFDFVVTLDFEFRAPPGERPDVHCLVAHELRSGAERRIWRDRLREMSESPFPTDETAVYVAHYATAEMSCFLALGWPLPRFVIDTYVEFKNLTNPIRPAIGGWSLLGMLAFFGLDGIETLEKKEMRDLAIRGAPFSAEERAALIEYCESDVDALDRVLPHLGRLL